MKRWIAGILCVSCLLMMTACSRNGEEVSGSQEESSQTMESSSESVEQPSEDSQPEEAAEPEEPVSSQPRTVSIRPVTSAEAEPVQVNVTARNAIAVEMAVVSDGQKAAEFAAELQSVVPSDQAIPSDAQPVEILLVYSMDGGEHRYQLYRESDADYIAKDGVLYQGGAGLSTWADAVIPALPAVPEGADAAQTSGTEQIVLKKSSLYRASERMVLGYSAPGADPGLDCGCPSVGGRVHPGYGRRNHRGELRGRQFLYIQQPDTGWSRTDEA